MLTILMYVLAFIVIIATEGLINAVLIKIAAWGLNFMPMFNITLTWVQAFGLGCAAEAVITLLRSIFSRGN